MDQLARLFIKLSLQSDSFLSQLRTINSKTQPIAQRIGKTLVSGIARIFKAGMKALGLAGAAILVTGFAAGITSINLAAKFEQEFAKVNAVLETTDSQSNRLRRSLIDLGLNPNFKISTQEAAESALVLAKNGLTAAQIMGGALEASTALANATTQEFGKSADVATDLVKIFGLENDNLAEAVNGAVGAINQSKFSLNDYRLALGQSGKVASIAGVGIEDFNTVIAGTANSFTSGSDAGTSFKVFLQRTIPQTDRAAEAMKKLGFQTVNQANVTEQLNEALATGGPAALERYEKAVKSGASQQEVLRKTLDLTRADFLRFAQETNVLDSIFFDTNGNMRDMTDIINDMAIGLGDVAGEEQKLALLTDAFGTDALRTAAALGTLGEVIPTSEFTEYAKSIGFTQDMLDDLEFLDTAGQLEEVRRVAGLSQEDFRKLGIETGFLTTEWLELSEKIGDTDAFEVARKQLDNLSDQFDILKDQLKQVGVSFGSFLLPGLQFLANFGSAILDTFLPQFTTVGEAARMFSDGLFRPLRDQLADPDVSIGDMMDTLGLSQFFGESLDSLTDWAGRAERIAFSFMGALGELGDATVFDTLIFALNKEGEFAMADRVRDLQSAFEDFRAGNFSGMLSNLGFSDEQITNLKEIRTNLKEIGESLSELFNFGGGDGDFSFLGAINNFLKFLVDNEDKIKSWAKWIGIIAATLAVVAGVAWVVTTAMAAWAAIMAVVGFVSALTFSPIIIGIAVVLGLIAAATVILRHFGLTWSDVWNWAVETFWNAQRTAEQLVILWLLGFEKLVLGWREMWSNIVAWWTGTVVPWWHTVTETAGLLVAAWALMAITMVNDWINLWQQVVDWWNNTVVPLWNEVVEWFTVTLPEAVKQFVAKVLLELASMYAKMAIWWNQRIKPILQKIKTWFTVTIPDAVRSARDAFVESMNGIKEAVNSARERIGALIDRIKGLGSSLKQKFQLNFGLNHANPGDTTANSPMKIHTRVMDFAKFLEKNEFGLEFNSNSGSVFDSVNKAVTETSNNVSRMTQEFNDALSDREFTVNFGANGSLGLGGAEAQLEAVGGEIEALRGDLANTASFAGTSGGNSEDNSRRNVFQDGAVTIQIEATDVENEDDFADFLARRILGDA